MSAMKEPMAALITALIPLDHTHVVVIVATCLTMTATHAMVTQPYYSKTLVS